MLPPLQLLLQSAKAASSSSALERACDDYCARGGMENLFSFLEHKKGNFNGAESCKVRQCSWRMGLTDECARMQQARRRETLSFPHLRRDETGACCEPAKQAHLIFSRNVPFSFKKQPSDAFSSPSSAMSCVFSFLCVEPTI